jgi:hypothetical protein
MEKIVSIASIQTGTEDKEDLHLGDLLKACDQVIKISGYSDTNFPVPAKTGHEVYRRLL